MKDVLSNIYPFAVTTLFENWLRKEIDLFLKKKNRVSFGIAGGKSPDIFIDFFNKYKSEYSSNVNFTLVDDRDVEELSSDSNYGQLRQKLDKSFAIVWPQRLFIEQINECPLDILALGMGEDGHIASIFPEVSDDDRIYSGCVFKTPPIGTPCVSRYSLSETTLMQASRVILVVRGKRKAEILDHMLANSLLNYPVVRLVTRHPNLVVFRI